MQQRTSYKETKAAQEIVGAFLLIIIAVVVGVSIYNYVLPVPLPPAEPSVYLVGYVNDDGTAIIEHTGGDTLQTYEVHVTLADETSVYEFTDDPWEIGESYTPPLDEPLFSQEGEVFVTIYTTLNDGSQYIVFDGVLLYSQRFFEFPPCINPMLISTLRTDTVDEDLICYDNGTFPVENASRYIFKWMLNYESFAEILMPFDLQNDTTAKDYSDNGDDATLVDVVWIPNGKVGGAYYFGGSSEYMALPLPDFFNDLANNDFTICLWLKSDDIAADHRIAAEGGKNNKDFTLIFQVGSEFHFGVCENGIKYAVRTDELQNDTWYHTACVWHAHEKSLEIFVNGVESTKVGYRNYASGVQQGFDLGHGTASSRFWLGGIDELQIYAHALSADQIDQLYRTSQNGFYNESVIVSEETLLGSIWQCIVIPHDGIQELDYIESNFLQIKSYPGGE
jgi:hypothetical protein